jgi:uncharacterized membrane protein
MQFNAPVAIPFPAPGIISVGFITSDGLRQIDDHLKKRMLCVFVPTAPTPFTGFVVYVPREDVIPLPMTVDEALRLIISCGVLVPPHQAISLAQFSAAAAAAGTPLPMPSPAPPAGVAKP